MIGRGLHTGVTPFSARMGSTQLRIMTETDNPNALAQFGTVTAALAGTTEVAILTGGADKPYALGLAPALVAQGVRVDFIGSDAVDGPVLHGQPLLTFRNLRGDQSENASKARKVWRVVAYYLRLLYYAWTARPRVFHILWNNKLEIFDRTVLLLYYRLLGKKIAYTAHNVNAGQRDGRDTRMNRWSLAVHYRLCDHIFVHTPKMKEQLKEEFGVPSAKVTVIPFGINNTIPTTSLTREAARRGLGLGDGDRVILFFGRIAPYKGIECLVAAFRELLVRSPDYRLVIAGTVKGCDDYWLKVQEAIRECAAGDRIVQHIEYIPDERVEMFMKAADVLVLPYTHIFQSGVLFLGYSFGLPVIAADVGSLREDIAEGETGFLFEPGDSGELAVVLERYFNSRLYRELPERRATIREYANDRYSWTRVGVMSREVYDRLLR